MAGTVITKKGMRLLVKLLATKGILNLTRVAVGTGIMPNGYDPASMIDLVQYKMDGLISGCKVDGDVAKITTQISSVGIETGFTISEMGIFAEEPDTGEEILYTYLDMKDDPQYIYAEGGQAQKFVEITLDVTIEAETRVTTYINPQSMITRREFMESMEKKVDVEGGDIANTKVSITKESNSQYPVPEDGETINIILGKLIKFCNDVKTGMCKVADIVNNCTSSDTDKPLAAAIGKTLWDKITDTILALTNHKTSGDHDSRYYTESEIDTKLGGKANSSHTHSTVTQSVAGLMSADDKKKLDGIAQGANAYSHPTGSGNNHIPSGGSSGQILRWSSAGTAAWGSDNNTTYGAATQSAAGLMSADDKKKLDGIASGANAYSHPTGNGNNHIPSGGSSGQILRWSSAGTAAWGSDNNTTYSAATQSAQGLMSAADKKKLDGITAGANMLKSDIVNNCTSTNTDKPLAAAQGKVLMDKYNQLNSDITPVIKTGLTAANANVSIANSSFIVIGKLCVISFEATIKAVFSSGNLIKLPSDMKPLGTYHFVCDFSNTVKHAWLYDNTDTIFIQDGAEKTGNIRGSAVFLLR